MGITGLIPFAKAASTEKHLKDFKGQTAAIDSYCWLHKGAFGCADKLAMGEKTDGYIQYCFKYIDMLLTFKIKPIMVFDGQNLPAKLLTEKKRRESRKQARKRATECLKLGNMTEARNNFRRCVDITPEMAFEFIKECRRRNIDCIVAPYEADAQLAYLNKNKMADFVISEDSDLLAFGCSKVLFKLDLTGRGTLIEADKLHLATKDRPDTFSFDKFRYMCILSGCDYLDSLPGIGLKKALKFIKNMPNDDIYNNMAKLPKILNMTTLVVTKEYRDQFMIADATFRHQLVFDVVQKKLVPLTDPEKCGTNLEYCCNSGKMLEDKIAYQIAVGNYNPFTHEEFSNWTPQKSNFSSIWCRSSYIPPNTPKNKNTIESMFKKEIKSSNKKIENNYIEEEPADDKIEEKLLMMYSITKIEQKSESFDETAEPPAKKLCLREKIEENSSPEKNSTSPVLSGRKKFKNPFLKKSKTNLLNKLNEASTIKTEENSIVSKYFCNKTNEDQNSTIQTDEYKSETNQCSPETKLLSPKINQHYPKINQHSPKMNQHNPIMNKHSPKMNQHSPIMNQHSPKMNQHSPEINQHSPEINQHSPKMNQLNPKLNQHSPNINQQSTKMNQHSPKINQHSPTLNQHSPNINQHSPKINQHSPKINQHSPKINKHSPKINQHSPKINQHSPKINQHSPKINQHSPKINQHSPKTNQFSRKIKDDNLEIIEENSDDEEELSSSLKENDKLPYSASSTTSIENDIKKIKISPKAEFKPQNFVKCRPQGLLKSSNKNNNKFKPNKNQRTLVSMFGFTKKNSC